MTATEILRRMLDECGVKWEDGGMPSTNTTFIVNGVAWHAMFRDGGIELHCEPVTPEQAIAATLGSCNCSNNCTNGERTETCHMEQTGHVKVAGVDYYDDDYECSECGAEIFEGYNFCPMCGRRIEQ